MWPPARPGHVAKMNFGARCEIATWPTASHLAGLAIRARRHPGPAPKGVHIDRAILQSSLLGSFLE
jgi:hypothetical protein